MKINFDEWNERRNTNCGKWDTMDKKYQKEGMLHLGVADMDFRSPKQIIDAFQDILDKGIFGYTDLSDRFYENIREWMRQKHQAEVSREEIVFCPRINVSSSICVETFTEEMDEVIINTPAYGPLYQAVVKNHRKVVESPLILENGSYKIDFAHLESVVTDKTKMFILCSPHNPVGRIWERETLARVGELCEKYHVTVLSDEIHCDITRPGTGYIPFAAASETCKNISVTCIAPTKAFNIAGIQTAAVMIPNEALHHKVWRALNTDEVAEPNVFAIGAAIAAFTKGEDWLEELREYLFENRTYMTDYIRKEIPQLKVTEADATYLLWVDCNALGCSAKELADTIRKTTGLYVSEGAQYGKTGEQFLRINLACQRSRIADGCERLKRGVEAYLSQK